MYISFTIYQMAVLGSISRSGVMGLYLVVISTHLIQHRYSPKIYIIIINEWEPHLKGCCLSIKYYHLCQHDGQKKYHHCFNLYHWIQWGWAFSPSLFPLCVWSLHDTAHSPLDWKHMTLIIFSCPKEQQCSRTEGPQNQKTYPRLRSRPCHKLHRILGTNHIDQRLSNSGWHLKMVRRNFTEPEILQSPTMG